MSLYNVTRAGAASPVRNTGGEKAADRLRTDASAAAGAVDHGVAVQTGSRIASGPAPVDTDRVAEIRAALRDNRYPIVPSQIADAMIAAKLMLSQGK